MENNNKDMKIFMITINDSSGFLIALFEVKGFYKYMIIRLLQNVEFRPLNKAKSK